MIKMANEICLGIIGGILVSLACYLVGLEAGISIVGGWVFIAMCKK